MCALRLDGAQVREAEARVPMSIADGGAICPPGPRVELVGARQPAALAFQRREVVQCHRHLGVAAAEHPLLQREGPRVEAPCLEQAPLRLAH